MPSTSALFEIKGIDLTLSGVERVQKFIFDNFKHNPGYNGFDTAVLKNDLTLISADPSGTTVFEMIVRDTHCNRLMSMHGGCVALVFDICTTTALIPLARPGFWEYTGVTRNLNITYIRPALVGSKITITSEIVHAGRQLATMKGTITSEDGKVLSVAEHLKVYTAQVKL